MATAAHRTGHPPGLYVLFFTELWERYSFYSMMAILSLYMNEALHFDVAKVGSIYGSYNLGVYFLPVFGGLAAVNIRGVRHGIRLSIVVTVGKLVPLVLLALVGLFAVRWSNLAWLIRMFHAQWPRWVCITFPTRRVSLPARSVATLPKVPAEFTA